MRSALWKQVAVAAGLVLLSLVLGWTGFFDRIAPWLSPPAAWRADRVQEAAPDSDPMADQREILIRLNAENAEMRHRLKEYQEIEGAGGVHLMCSVLCRARVTARSDRASRRHLRIDAGVYAGVRKQMAVVVGWSLIGLVVGEHPAESLVRLVTDPDSRIPAHLLTAPATDAEGQVIPAEVVALGVVAGTGDPQQLTLDFVEDRPDLRVLPGMVVISAGGPGTVPPGLVLGEVESAERLPESDHWRIVVAPARRGDLAASVLVLRAPSAAVDQVE